MLHESHSHQAAFDELADCVDELVIVLDDRLKVASANRAALIAFGYPIADLMGMSLARLVENSDRRRVAAIVAGVDERRADSALFRSRTGRKMCSRFSVSPLRRGADEARAYLLVLPRPRGRRAAEPDPTNGLAASLLKSFAAPLFIVDGRSRTVRDCNESAVAISGYDRAELVGRRLLYHARGSEERLRCLSLEDKAYRAYATTGIFQERISYPRKDAPPIPCDFMGIPFFTAEGSLDVIIGMLFDRSAEEDREAELSQLIKQVGELASQLEALTSGFSRREKPKRLCDLGFTPRQIEIARLCASGAPSKEIGFRLGIAESTVKNHLQAMYRKIGANSRVTFLSALSARRIKIG
jgi:PAS domain S-box